MQQLRRTRLQQGGATMSPGDGDPNGPALGASGVGAELRAVRLQLGLALPDIAAKLRIRLPFLEAIEDGRIADLPGNVYAIGFMRNYAKTLGLDANELARRFRVESHEVDRKPELAFPAPMADRGMPAGAVALLGVLLMAGGYAGWHRLSGDAQPPAEVVPVMPEHLAPLAERPAPVSVPSPQVASLLQGPSASALAALALAAPPAVAPAAVAPPPVAAPLSPVSPMVAAATIETPVMNDGRVVLRFNADAWIQVKERQGPVLLNRIMRAGDTWPVPKGTQLLLSTGNAGGTELVVDGEPIPALGPAGAIRRDVALDADALKVASTGRPPAQ